jgi:hypothetical protein
MNSDKSYEETIARVINLHKGLSEFWGGPGIGWAREESQKNLEKFRLDKLWGQSSTLKRYRNTELLDNEGDLITAWTTLGSLLEGLLKFWLTVFIREYRESNSDRSLDTWSGKTGTGFKDPHKLSFEQIKRFFAIKIFPKDLMERFVRNGQTDWIEWIGKIQYNRNSIHSLVDRNIGTKKDFYEAVENYLELLRNMNEDLPYCVFRSI